MRIHLGLFILLVLLPAGCVPRQQHVSTTGAPTFIHPLPAVFQAHLELKKCPPTSFELVLRPDGMYYLQMERKDSGNAAVQAAVQAEVGIWRYNEKEKSVRLTGYDKAVHLFTLKGKNILKLRKVSGGMMPRLVRYDFTLVKTVPRYEGVVRMRGMYMRRRGRGIFRECLSGATFPFASGVKTAEIERPYQDILHGREESLLVTLDMRLSSGSGRHELLIPVRSVTLDPYHSCQGKGRRIATIVDNRWYLTELAGKAVDPESVTKLPFLKVQSGEQLIQGFAGCNHFTGSWLFANNEFVFSRIRSTRMACPLGMEVEDAFLQALDNTRRYTIRGNTLNLYDRQGRVSARLRYSRKLTDLDFRYQLPDQESSDDTAVSASHSVVTEGAVPTSVVRTPEREVDEKTLPLPEEYGDDKTAHHKRNHKIIVLKAKKKVAVGKKTQAAAKPAQAEEVAPAPKPSASPAIETKQKQEEQQDDKTVAPLPSPPVSGDQGKSVVDVVEKEEEKAEAPAESVDKPEPAPQMNRKEELPPSPESSVPIAEKNEQKQNEQKHPVEQGSGGDEAKSPAPEDGKTRKNTSPAEEPVGQTEMQTGTEKGIAPALPPIPEANIPETDEGEQQIQLEPATNVESDDQITKPEAEKDIPSDETPESQVEDNGKETEPALPTPETQAAVQTRPASESSCMQPWKTPLTEISGQITKVEITPPPWSRQRGLHLEVETSSESFLIHVFPEKLMAQCQELFNFKAGEKVTVAGSEFSTGKGHNLCAATITRGSNVLQLRDPVTSTFENQLCCQQLCQEQCNGRPEMCMNNCLSRCRKSMKAQE